MSNIPFNPEAFLADLWSRKMADMATKSGNIRDVDQAVVESTKEIMDIYGIDITDESSRRAITNYAFVVMMVSMYVAKLAEDEGNPHSYVAAVLMSTAVNFAATA